MEEHRLMVSENKMLGWGTFKHKGERVKGRESKLYNEKLCNYLVYTYGKKEVGMGRTCDMYSREIHE